jgi:hypothetical protein
VAGVVVHSVRPATPADYGSDAGPSRRPYQVLTVPIAIQAGMGELGRHGVVITKELGSALKVATVTTDLPLVYDEGPHGEAGVRQFQAGRPTGLVRKARAQLKKYRRLG